MIFLPCCAKLKVVDSKLYTNKFSVLRGNSIMTFPELSKTAVGAVWYGDIASTDTIVETFSTALVLRCDFINSYLSISSLLDTS